MKKYYISPSTEIISEEATDMLATSLLIEDETVDGADALTRDIEWEIWNDEINLTDVNNAIDL